MMPRAPIHAVTAPEAGSWSPRSSQHTPPPNLRRVYFTCRAAGVENPHARQFNRNPAAAIVADRSRYVAAVLTIVQAYAAAGVVPSAA